MEMISKFKNFLPKRVNPLEIFIKKEELPDRFKEWGDHFGGLKKMLEALQNGSEEKFLHIGSRLQDFAVRSRKLSEMTEAISLLTSGKEINNAITGLREQLTTMSQYFGKEKDASNGSMKKLQNILGTISWLETICDDFARLTRMLRFLSISIRIENARIDQKNMSGFHDVSEDVRKLADDIDVKSGNVMDNSKTLALTVQSSVAKTNELTRIQKNTTANLLEDAQISMTSLVELNEKSSGMSARIVKRSSEIYKNIGSMVASLQFHDITRQQLEHVRDVLGNLQERLEEADEDHGNMTQEQSMEFAGWVSNVCELQFAQLINTKKELESAVYNIIDKLKGISRNVLDMTSDTRELSGNNQHSDSSLLSNIEKGIVAAIQALRNNEKIEGEITSSVNSAIHGMAEFIKEIEEIGAQIKLIALNAQVRAVCAGEEGRTFEVLAGEIQRLSADTRGQTADVLEKLQSIIAGDKTQHVWFDPASEKNAGSHDRMIHTLEHMLESLNHVNEEFVLLLNKIIESGQALGVEIGKLTEQIVFHEEMAGTINEVANRLNETAAIVRERFPESTTYENADNLESIASFYTTEGERNVHMAVTGIAVVHEGVEADMPEIKNDEEEMGDNIELF
ncbi:MAG: methyl-accepting chemotaxis protein [Candidatus Kuenenia sp.]|nr:methyl-accepting chemotaxis protein [Candidatus Kuenenia hertensis]